MIVEHVTLESLDEDENIVRIDLNLVVVVVVVVVVVDVVVGLEMLILDMEEEVVEEQDIRMIFLLRNIVPRMMRMRKIHYVEYHLSGMT